MECRAIGALDDVSHIIPMYIIPATIVAVGMHRRGCQCQWRLKIRPAAKRTIIECICSFSYLNILILSVHNSMYNLFTINQ